MANIGYDKGKRALLDWLITQDARVGLFDNGYSPSASDNFLSTITAHEIGVTGYARQVLAGMAVTQDDANTRAYFTANNNVWAALAAGATLGWAVVYVNTGSDATSKLYGAFQIIPATPTNGGSFTIQWASGASVPGGVIQIS